MKTVVRPFIALLAALLVVAAFGGLSPAAAQEGPVVLDIVFRGNDNVDDEDILAVMEDIRVGEPLDVDGANEDIFRIFEMGYFYDVVANVEPLVGIRNGIRFVVEVFEFPVLQQVAVTAEGVPADEIVGWMETKEGRILNQRELERDLVAIQDRAVEQYGLYLRPAVIDLDEDNDGLVLEFTAARVGQVSFTGNVKTKDHVVAREITIQPGDFLNRQQVQRTLQRLSLTGFYNDVGARFDETDQLDTLDVVFELEERKTGMASFGAGYSSQEGFLGYVEVADENFLGRGQRANVRWEFGRQKNAYELGFYEPYLFGSTTSFGINLYNSTREFTQNLNQIESRRRGGDITLGRPLGEFTRGFIGYSMYDWKSLENGLLADEGETRSITLSAVTDTRDHPFSPTKGFRTRFAVERAGGFLGGTDEFTKYDGTYSTYIKIGEKDRQALALRAMLGHGQSPGGGLKDEHKFRVGGADTLRGYGEMRGDRQLVMNAEFRLPLSEAVEAAVFTDFGNAFNYNESFSLDKLKVGYGVGLRLDTPLGMIRIDYGIGDEGGRAYFSLGPSF